MQRAVETGTNQLFSRILERSTLTDHTLADLEAMDHPYSTRKPQQIHDPNWSVHTQEGSLAAATQKSVVHVGNESTGKVALNESVAPHARYVIMGTVKMIPRDFLRGSLDELREDLKKLIREVAQTVTKTVGRRL